MKNLQSLIFATLLCLVTRGSVAQTNQPVTITEDDLTYTMSNGYLTLKIDKRTADLISVKTINSASPNVELMGYVSGHHAGYWEQSEHWQPEG